MGITFHNLHTALQNDYDKDYFVLFYYIMTYVIFYNHKIQTLHK